MYVLSFYGLYKRGLPEMNSCNTGLIQYKPTNNITKRLKKSNAPPNKNVCSFEELSSAVSCTKACKF